MVLVFDWTQSAAAIQVQLRNPRPALGISGAEALTYRLLDVDTEWPRLAPEFESRGFPLPDPALAMIVGAFDDSNTLQGFLVCQFQFHFEPLVLYSPHVLRGLVTQMEKELVARVGPARYFAFAPSELIAGICKSVGMEPVMMPMYVKQLV